MCIYAKRISVYTQAYRIRQLLLQQHNLLRLNRGDTKRLKTRVCRSANAQSYIPHAVNVLAIHPQAQMRTNTNLTCPVLLLDGNLCAFSRNDV